MSPVPLEIWNTQHHQLSNNPQLGFKQLSSSFKHSSKNSPPNKPSKLPAMTLSFAGLPETKPVTDYSKIHTSSDDVAKANLDGIADKTSKY